MLTLVMMYSEGTWFNVHVGLALCHIWQNLVNVFLKQTNNNKTKQNIIMYIHNIHYVYF